MRWLRWLSHRESGVPVFELNVPDNIRIEKIQIFVDSNQVTCTWVEVPVCGRADSFASGIKRRVK